METGLKPPFSQEQLTEHLRAMGVVEGSTFMPHTSLKAIRPVVGGPETIVRSMIDAVGPQGTVVFPAFTFSYCKTGQWDRVTTPSEMGVITEVARNWPGSHRSLHPIYSVAVIGAKAEEYGACCDPNGVGDDSPFALLERDNAIFGLLGVGYNQGIVAGHRLEWQLAVDYRLVKVFPGDVTDGGIPRPGDYSMLVRSLDDNVVTDFRKLGYMLEHVGAMQVGRYGWSIARTVCASEFRTNAARWLGERVPNLMHRTDAVEAFEEKPVELLTL